jgi:hypothetical protein
MARTARTDVVRSFSSVAGAGVEAFVHFASFTKVAHPERRAAEPCGALEVVRSAVDDESRKSTPVHGPRVLRADVVTSAVHAHVGHHDALGLRERSEYPDFPFSHSWGSVGLLAILPPPPASHEPSPICPSLGLVFFRSDGTSRRRSSSTSAHSTTPLASRRWDRWPTHARVRRDPTRPIRRSCRRSRQTILGPSHILELTAK